MLIWYFVCLTGTGHGVGAALNVHEGPQSISFRYGNMTPLQNGMIVSNEPGYYEDHAFGIRIEVRIGYPSIIVVIRYIRSVNNPMAYFCRIFFMRKMLKHRTGLVVLLTLDLRSLHSSPFRYGVTYPWVGGVIRFSSSFSLFFSFDLTRFSFTKPCRQKWLMSLCYLLLRSTGLIITTQKSG